MNDSGDTLDNILKDIQNHSQRGFRDILSILESLEDQLPKDMLNPIEVLLYPLYLEQKKLSHQSSGKKIKTLLFRLKESFLVKLENVQRKHLEFSVGKTLLVAIEPSHILQLQHLIEKGDENSFIWFTSRIKILQKLKSITTSAIIFFGDKSVSILNRDQAGLIFDDEKTITQAFSTLPDRQKSERLRTLVLRTTKSLDRLATYLLHFLQEAKPKNIIVANDLTPEGRIAVMLGKKLGIPTASIQHGLITHDDANGCHIVDRFFVYGEVFKQILMADGFPANRITISGAPYQDNLELGQTKVAHPAIRRKFNLTPGQPYILVALSGHGHLTSLDNYRLTIEILIKAVRALAPLPFIFKLHRKDKPAYYEEVAKREGLSNLNLALHNDPDLPESIFDWFPACKTLITGTSTVGLEALFFKVPVISLDPLSEFKGVDFIDQEAASYVHSLEELLAAIGKFELGELPKNHGILAGQYFFRGPRKARSVVGDWIKNPDRAV